VQTLTLAAHAAESGKYIFRPIDGIALIVIVALVCLFAKARG
jgi:hypothetical protein